MNRPAKLHFKHLLQWKDLCILENCEVRWLHFSTIFEVTLFHFNVFLLLSVITHSYLINGMNVGIGEKFPYMSFKNSCVYALLLQCFIGQCQQITECIVCRI